MNIKTVKGIEFAYPTSTNAGKLGFAKIGCWHISQTQITESGQLKTVLPRNAKGFSCSDDPDLIASFQKMEGEVAGWFLSHGDEKALKALKLLTK